MLLTARQVGSALENARLYTRLDESYRLLKLAKLKIENYSKALDAEMEKGKKIQRDFLPGQIPCIPGWEIAACSIPPDRCPVIFMTCFYCRAILSGW